MRNDHFALFFLFTLASGVLAAGPQPPKANEKFLAQLDDHYFIYNDADYFIKVIEEQGYLEQIKSQFKTKVSEFRGSATNNSCINGEDPTNLTPQQQLQLFVQGPCAPFIIAPGLFSSKLTVAIDCPTLQSKNPAIFSACGWNSCSSSVFSSAPLPEYDLWISSFTSPMSLVLPSTSECWGQLIKLTYNPNEEDWNKKFTSPVGVNVSVYGADPNTEEEAECGFGAIVDLMDSPVQTMMTRAWLDFEEAFVSLGYQIGLTLYGAPYDWRKTTLANESPRYLNDTVRQVYNLTGKPVVILSHSLGNYGVLNMLNNMSLQDKETMIYNWISFLNPLAGATKTPFITVGGDPDFSYFKFGMVYQAQKNFMANSTVVFDLYPKDTYQRFANEEWMQEWAARQALENKYNVTTPEGKAEWEKIVQGSYPLEWFPSPLNNCSRGFTERPDDCSLRMFNWSSTPTVIVNNNGKNTSYNASTEGLQDLLEKYHAFDPNYESMLDVSTSNGAQMLTNPEVPVTLIFGSHLTTQQGAYYSQDPLINLENNEYAFPAGYMPCAGDNTVPTASSLLPGIKWVWEYQNGLAGAKPLKVVEYCSIYNQRGTPYDVIKADAPYEITNVSYIGLDCDCLTGTEEHPVTGSDCQHADAPSDSKVIQFAINTVFNNYIPQDTKYTGAFKLNNDQLINVSNSCPTVVPGTQVYWNYIYGKNEDTLINTDELEIQIL